MGEDKVDFYGIGLLTCFVIPVGAVLLVIAHIQILITISIII